MVVVVDEGSTVVVVVDSFGPGTDAPGVDVVDEVDVVVTSDFDCAPTVGATIANAVAVTTSASGIRGFK